MSPKKSALSDSGKPDPVFVTESSARDYVIGIYIGVRQIGFGIARPSGEILESDAFETPRDPSRALSIIRNAVKTASERFPDRSLRLVGVTVPGTVDNERTRLQASVDLGWYEIDLKEELAVPAPIVVENDAAAAAIYETAKREGPETADFILVRSGSGISGAFVVNNEVVRGVGAGLGIASELGHTTVVAGGKQCACGNRGCWEKYASAASAASLYLGDRPPARSETVPRFVEIVSKAENGDNRSRRTLEKIGDYLGIGVANVMIATGILQVVISGRMVHGWKFIEKPVRDAILRGPVRHFEDWSVIPGTPEGGELGGAIQVAIEAYAEIT